ncbi:MAG: FxsA family protein [Pseudomonadota bacterium]
MRIFLLLLPWLELFTLIQLGVETSALTALAWVFATLFLGLFLLQRQGMGMFERLRQAQDGRVLGPQLLLDDVAVGLAALLLMVPGLISDCAAVLVMFGPLRRRLARWWGGPQAEPYRPEMDREANDTIEGSFRRIDD